MTPLIQGLEKTVDAPASVVKAILNWTAGQPFLTQKLCDKKKSVFSPEAIPALPHR